jgi:hypothetical protein
LKTQLLKFICVSIIFCFGFTITVFAQAPAAGTVNFESITGVNISSTTGTATWVPLFNNQTSITQGLGLDFAITGSTANTLSVTVPAATDQGAVFSSTGTGTSITGVYVKSKASGSVSGTTLNNPGSRFALKGMNISLVAAGSVTLTFTGYQNGTSIGSFTQTISTTAETAVTFPTSLNFLNIDELRITGAIPVTGLRLDDIVIDNAAPYDVNAAVNSVPEGATTGTLANVTASFGTSTLGNLALNKPVTVSSAQLSSGVVDGRYVGAWAVDGVSSTNASGNRWADNSTTSTSDPNPYIIVDLGRPYIISSVVTEWESYATSYRIQGSNSSTFSTFTTLKTITGNASANTTDNVTATGAYRYIRIYTDTKNNGAFLSIWELQIFGSLPAMTYSLTADPSSANNPFTINSSTGVISVANGSYLNADVKSSYTVTVTANDGNSTTSAPFTIAVITGSTNVFSNYSYRAAITIPSSKWGLTQDETSFPVLVRITNNADLKATGSCDDKVIKPGGTVTTLDLAFTDSTAAQNTTTELPYQIEKYDATTGTLLAWVLVPKLYAGSDTRLYLYFGSASPTHAATLATSVWPADYKAVYHFNEATFSTAAGAVKDATSNGISATTTGMTTVSLTTGQIGNSYSFDGSTSKITTAAALDITGSFTLSAWVKMGTAVTDEKVMTNQTNTGSGSGGYKLGLYNSVGETESGSTINRGKTPSTTLTAGNWYYIQGVYSSASTTISTYINGVPYSLNTAGANPTATGSPLYIGVGEGGNTYYFNGLIDEVRVSTTAKSTNWLLAEYKNQSNPVTYVGLTEAMTNGHDTYTYTGTANAPADGSNWTHTTLVGTQITGSTPPGSGVTPIIVIPAGKTVTYPSVTGGYQTPLHTITIGTGSSLNLNSSILVVACNIFNNGTINDNGQVTSGMTFNGKNAAQYYTAASGSSASVSNLTINNTYNTASGGSTPGKITVSGGNLNVYKLLTVTQGNLFIDNANSGFLTLKSTATQSAAVAVNSNPTTYSVTGMVNAERFITGGNLASQRGYRLLSSPVNQTSATASTTNTINLAYLSGKFYTYGTYAGAFTAGSGGPTGGFTASNANPTIYLYKESLATNNSTFVSGKNIGVTSISSTSPSTVSLSDNTTKSIPVGNGYILYFVGPSTRTTGAASGGNPTDVTLTSQGYLNQGDIPVTIWWSGLTTLSNASPTGTKGYNMVGNPYASTIDLSKVITDNTASIDNVYLLTDASPGQSYVAYTASGSSAPGSGYALSGQGFMVHVKSTATTPTLTFKETQKAPAQQLTGSALLMGIPKQSADITGLYVKLEQDSTLYDYCGIYFNKDWSDKFEDGDALDLDGLSSSIFLSSYSSDGMRMAVNHLSDYSKGKRVKLYANINSNGLYKLKVEGIRNIDTLYNIWLIDHYKKDSLDIRRYGTYNFNIIRSDTASYGANRFELVFRLRPLAAYQLTSFTGERVSDGIRLTWKVQNEGNYTGFIVQKQDGSQTYLNLYQLQSNGNGTYSYTDHSPNTGNNWYRLSQNDINESISYSPPVNVAYIISGNAADVISLYPNPVTTATTVNLNLVNPVATSYEFTIYSNDGMKMMQKITSSLTWTQDMSQLKPGMYFIEIRKKDGTLVGKTKFVKY